MGIVTPDPRKGDQQLPGGQGLVVDLGLMACPQCRREVPDWRTDCPDCEVDAVPKTSLPSMTPDVPAHLLLDDDEDDEDAED